MTKQESFFLCVDVRPKRWWHRRSVIEIHDRINTKDNVLNSFVNQRKVLDSGDPDIYLASQLTSVVKGSGKINQLRVNLKINQGDQGKLRKILKANKINPDTLVSIDDVTESGTINVALLVNANQRQKIQVNRSCYVSSELMTKD